MILAPLAILLLSLVPAEEAAAPNVLMILADDQSWTDYGFMDHATIQTPHLDSLAEGSLLYTNGYVPAALCRPSLATIATGLYSHQHRITGNDPPRDVAREQLLRHIRNVPTLPRLLAKAGYRCMQSGKWWEGNPSEGGFTEGMTHGDPTRGGRHGDQGLKIGREPLTPVTDFMDDCQSKGEPFLLWYAPFLPHRPHNPPKRLLDLYKDVPGSPSQRKYWAMCTWFDETCGELLGHLEKRGTADNTLVVFVSDNGWIQNPNGSSYMPRSKRSSYEAGVRTPIMLRWPGQIDPERRAHPISSIDLMPTVLRACGVAVPEGLPGLDLLAETQPDPARRAVMGARFTHDMVDIMWPAASCLDRWIVKDGWKLIVPTHLRGPAEAQKEDNGVPRSPELYSLTEDPFEQQELSAREPARVAAMTQALDDWYSPTPAPAPNIVLILADDLGYGDVHSYNDESKIPTPHIDRLAGEGMRFTDVHSPSSVCTPTRYALLSGRYAWRSALKSSVLWPWDPPLLEDERLTMPEYMRAAGYRTACIGKWHLGWDWPLGESSSVLTEAKRHTWPRNERESIGQRVNWDRPIAGGPLAHGFDHYFGDDVPNFPPYAFIENERVSMRPSAQKPKEMFGHEGPATPAWDLSLVMPTLAQKACGFIDEHARAETSKPFFLYLPLTAPHTPIAPSPHFQGKTGAGAYGDFVHEVDWYVGRVLETLERNGLTENTLVIFTSDNGSPQRDGSNMSGDTGSVRERYGHDPSRPWRGMKSDAWEGGHRVPFIMRWPGRLDAGRVCDEPLILLDLYRTLAQLTGQSLPKDAGEDSFDFSPLLTLLDTSELPPIREHLVHHSGGGVFALRSGPWKLIFGKGSGGFTRWMPPQDAPAGQLYNLDVDPGELNNLYGQEPEVVARLSARMQEIKDAGRSAPLPAD